MTPRAADDEIAQIESAMREIERYLDAHPHSSDALEGVCDWWLAALGAPRSPAVVLAALDRLVKAGRVNARAIPGGVVYERSREGKPDDG